MNKTKAIFSNKTVIKYISLSLCLLLCLATLLIYFASFYKQSNQTVKYPLENEFESYNPYVQQFDAFMKGQLHFDYEPSEELTELENPYDPSERRDVYFLYDRAYFEGKYYSYFGTAPIFTIMFPCYLISGSLPSDAAIQFVFALIFLIFTVLLVFTLSEKISSRVHPVLVALIAYATAISSLILLFARGRTPFYYIAATSAMAFLAAFAYFLFKGIFAVKRLPRIIMLLLAGLSFALCFHSRINTAFTAVFFIIPVIVFGIVLKKREAAGAPENSSGFVAFCKAHRVGDIAAELCALAAFVTVGFVLAFIYNYARFGNILDFGSAYQLTVGDASKYKLAAGEFGYSIFHYFLAPLRRENGLNLGYYKISTLGRYLYVDGHFGILEVPFTAAAFLPLFSLTNKKRSVMLRTTCLSALIGCFVIAWVDFCLGGVIYRYLCDFSAIFAVLAAVGLLILFDRIYDLNRPCLKYILIAAVVLFIILSIYKTFKIMSISNANLLATDIEALFFKLFGARKSG